MVVPIQITENPLLDVLYETRAFLARPDNNFLWSTWDNAEQALQELDRHIADIETGQTLDRLNLIVLFAPTGDIQEVSISSGWGEHFLDLAARFDAAIVHV